MASLTVENYLKAIYLLAEEHRSGQGPPVAVATGAIAESLDVSPGTVTSMLKTLADSSLVSYRPYEGVQLTVAGQALALRVIRRHRLIELFLARTLNLTWDEVHDEAEHMEHAVSDWLVDRMEQYLGHPRFDPHGDPIPQADGTIRRADGLPLSELREGESFCVVRVVEQSPAFLRELSNAGIAIGVVGSVAKQHQDGSRTVELVGHQQTLRLEVAQQLFVNLQVT